MHIIHISILFTGNFEKTLRYFYIYLDYICLENARPFHVPRGLRTTYAIRLLFFSDLLVDPSPQGVTPSKMPHPTLINLA